MFTGGSLDFRGIVYEYGILEILRVLLHVSTLNMWLVCLENTNARWALSQRPKGYSVRPSGLW